MVGVRGRRWGLDACHAANRRALATSRNAQPGARFRCRNPSPFEPLLGGQRPLVQAQAADRISATRLDDRGRRSLPARRSVQRHGRSPPHSGSGRTADRLAGEPHVAPLRRVNWTNPDQSLAVDGDPCTATTGKREGRRRAARRARRVVLEQVGRWLRLVQGLPYVAAWAQTAEPPVTGGSRDSMGGVV
jgi:hypothetical protein